MASPEESNRSRKKLDCGNSLKWLSLWDLSCSDIAGCSRGLDVFGSRSCLLENNSWNRRGGWTTGRKKVLNILIANFAGEHNAVELSRPHKFKSWHFQTAGHQSRLRKQVSLCVLPVKRENGALHGWTGWKGNGEENSQMFLAVPREGERKLTLLDKLSELKMPLFFCQEMLNEVEWSFPLQE